ncbi:MAG: caspase family protein [Devosia sp.]
MTFGSRFSHRTIAFLVLAPVCFLGAMTATGAQARENYALIVADSDYPNLDQKYWLKGPKNDEVLVRDYLINSAPVKFEPQNVVALGSGDGMQLGTHQAILDSLAKLAAEAKAGDFVYLHFSGHGSQQPAKTDTTETDGRDEVFLAADTEMAPKDNPSFLPNVLTDDEVSGALKAIRKTGAFVWVVFDSCHSGTMTRGAPEDGDVAERKVDPSDLGIPDSAFTQVAVDDSGSNERAVPLGADAYADTPDDPNMGGLVAFFAAQTSETTQERGFDVAQADGTTAKVPYGVFTYTIFSELAKNPNMTYRQLAQSVLASYAAENALKPTPLFEGKLDAPVFGNEDAAAAQQWPTVVGGDGSITISAGQLHGLSAGTKLLLLPAPSATDDQAIGLMEVASTTQLRAKLQLAADDKHPLIDIKVVPTGAYVRLEQVAYPFELTVSKPAPATTDPAQIGAISEALASILADPHAPLKLKVVDSGQAADVRLAVLSDDQVAKLGGSGAVQKTSYDATPKLWLLPATGEVSLDPTRAAPTMPIPAGATATDTTFSKGLEDNLVTIFRAAGLSRLSATSTFKPKDFKLSFGLQQAGSDAIAEMTATDTPIIRPGDRLHVDLTNSSGKPMDVNVLYIDHNYGITLICQSHLANGDHLFQPMADISDTDAGSERLVAVINESGKDITDLSFLTQPGLRDATRGPGEEGLLGMLADLGSGVPTRGPTIIASADTKTPRGAVVMMPVEALAPTGADPASGIAPTDPRTAEGSCAG